MIFNVIEIDLLLHLTPIRKDGHRHKTKISDVGEGVEKLESWALLVGM